MTLAGFVRKMNGTSGVDSVTMNCTVSGMVEEALKYNQMENVLENGEEEDIFSPKYFEKLSDIKMPATNLEILVKILRKQIKEYGKVNQLVAKSFQEMLEKALQNIMKIANILLQKKPEKLRHRLLTILLRLQQSKL